MSLTDEEKKATLAKIFEEDIEAFGHFFFPNHLKEESPDFHREILSLYQNPDLRRIAIAAPRGHAKSTITDLLYLAWVICNKKAKFIILVSDTYSQSVMFLEALKAEFESNDKLTAFYGKFVTDTWSEGEIIAQETMVKAAGAGMKIRGLKFRENRPDLIVIDDLENDELVESKDRRDKLERWFNGALVPAMGRDGRIIVIGTILHYDSLLSKLISEDKYLQFTKRKYQAITEGKALWPTYLSLEDLEKIKQDFITNGQLSTFYMEYQNDPVTDENRKFKIEKFRFYDETDIQYNELNHYITIDRAYSKEKTADSTGIIVVAVDNQNNWYIKLAERFKGNEQELIDKIFNLHSYYRPVKMGIEQKAFTYTLGPTLTNEMRKRNNFFIVEELKDLGRSKNIRIEGLVPRFELGTIFLKREMTTLVDELTTFPKGIHDDLIDALAYQLEMVGSFANGTGCSHYYPSSIIKRAKIRP